MNLSLLRDWIAIIGGIVIWVFTAGVLWTKLTTKIDTTAKVTEEGDRLLTERMKNAREEVILQFDHRFSELRNQINGFGSRLSIQESACAELSGRLSGAEQGVAEIRAQSHDVLNRLGKVEGKVDGVDAHVTEMKLELFGHLSDIKNLIAEKDSNLRQFINDRDTNMRERMARVEERRDIPHRER